MLGLEWANLTWRPLRVTSLDGLASSLSHPAIADWLARGHRGTVREKLSRRAVCEARGETIHLVPHRDGEPLGFGALLPYPGLPGRLQTSIYLARAAWGTGLYRHCATLLWAVGHDVLGHELLIASSHVENGRSRAARQKISPGIEPRIAWEPWMPRLATVFELSGPPEPAEPMAHAELAKLRRLVRSLPGYPRLRSGAGSLAA